MMTETADRTVACWWWDVIESVDEENEDLVWFRTVSKLLHKYKTTSI